MHAPQRRFELSVLPDLFAIVRLPANASVPPWAESGRFSSATRTPDELSIVCDVEHVPPAIAIQELWSALKVHGPFAPSEVGVLAALANPLSAANVSVFTISTFDTDYLFVRTAQLTEAIDALRGAGHKIHDARSAS